MSEVSFILSVRNEFPNIVHTINSLMIDCHQSGIDRWEAILVDNGSNDKVPPLMA